MYITLALGSTNHERGLTGRLGTPILSAIQGIRGVSFTPLSPGRPGPPCRPIHSTQTARQKLCRGQQDPLGSSTFHIKRKLILTSQSLTTLVPSCGFLVTLRFPCILGRSGGCAVHRVHASPLQFFIKFSWGHKVASMRSKSPP